VYRHSSTMANRSSLLRSLVVVGLCGCSDIIMVSASTAIDPRCGVSCGDHGSCQPSNITSTCTTTYCEFECACDHGWHGDDCMLQYEVCDDSITGAADDARTCYNGGKCEIYDLETPDINGKTTGFRCNCQTYANDTKSYAGYQCEYAEQDVCIRNRFHSSYAFCTNNGTCTDLIDFGEKHPLCNCPQGFAGRYCQYKVDSSAGYAAPSEEVDLENTLYYGNGTIYGAQSSNDDNNELSGGMKFFVVFASIGAFVIICICCYFFVKKRRSRKEVEADQEKSKSNDSELL
jgi:EGF-like domain